MPYFKGNSFKNLDLSLFKNFSVGSKGQKIQLRISAYNALNHPQWYPDGSLNMTLRYTNGVQTSPTSARSTRTTSTAGGSCNSRCASPSRTIASRSDRAGVATGGARLFRLRRHRIVWTL